MTFEATDDLNRPITTQTRSLTEENFDLFWQRYRLKTLFQADGEEVYLFKDVEEGGSYRAVTEHENWTNRFYRNEQVLLVETAHYLADALRSTCSNVHMDLTLGVYAGEDHDVYPPVWFDAVIHGEVSGSAFAIVLELTTNANPDLDIDTVLEKAELFRSFLSSPSPIYCDAGYGIPRVPFEYKNVTTVVPCLAGRFFPPELVEVCIRKGIIPIYPTGAHFTADNLNLLYDLLRK